MDSLLPGNAGDGMRAEEAVSAERWRALGLSRMRQAHDPWDAPAEMLPWLAYQAGLDLWFEDWPDLHKRRAIAEAPRLQRLRGTLDGFRAYLSLVDVPVTYARTPPGDAYLEPPLSDAAQQRWLSGLPQIRLRPYRVTAGVAEGDGFLDVDFVLDGEVGTVLAPPDGELIGERPFLARDGVETPLSILSAERHRGEILRGVFGVPLEAAHPPVDGGLLSEVAFEPAAEDLPLDLDLIEASAGDLYAIRARRGRVRAPFEVVRESAPVEPGESYLDGGWALDVDLVFGPAGADRLVYRRLYLSDGSTPEVDVDGDLVFDRHIWDFPASTLILGIDVSEPHSGPDHIWGLSETWGMFDDPPAMRLDRAVQAIRRAQGGTDVVVIDAQTFRPVTLFDAPAFGFEFGSMIQRTPL